MTEYLFDHDRYARDQWCPGIAGESTPGVDYEHEHRVAEHEHEGPGAKRGQASLMFYRIYITDIPDTRLCSRSRGWLEPQWRTSRRGNLDEVPVVAELPVWLDEQPCLHR